MLIRVEPTKLIAISTYLHAQEEKGFPVPAEV